MILTLPFKDHFEIFSIKLLRRHSNNTPIAIVYELWYTTPNVSHFHNISKFWLEDNKEIKATKLQFTNNIWFW